MEKLQLLVHCLAFVFCCHGFLGVRWRGLETNALWWQSLQENHSKGCLCSLLASYLQMVYGNILPVSLKVTALRVIVQEEYPTLTKKHALGFIYLFALGFKMSKLIRYWWQFKLFMLTWVFGTLNGSFRAYCRLFAGEGNSNPLQCSFLENPMDRGAWWVHGVPKSQTPLKRLSTHSYCRGVGYGSVSCSFCPTHIAHQISHLK